MGVGMESPACPHLSIPLEPTFWLQVAGSTGLVPETEIDAVKELPKMVDLPEAGEHEMKVHAGHAARQCSRSILVLVARI